MQKQTYAIADLHGNYNLWRQIIDSLNEKDTLFILGDCSDRGPDGWKIIKEALTDPRVIYIRGNHEQMLLDAWRYDWSGEDFYLWQYNGGYETFEALIQDENHQKYLTQLNRTKLYHCYKNKNGQKIHLSHAGFTLMYGDAIPYRHELLWGRDHIEDSCFWWSKENPNDYVVHGHTFCGSSRFKHISVYLNTEFNDTLTVCRYAHGHKICIDGRTYVRNQIAMLNLDTLEEVVFYDTH